MNRALSLGIAIWIGLLAPTIAGGETMYVIDRLLVGVHEDKTRDSAVVKVVPTATSLEVMEKDKDLVKVRTPEGTEGWVDAKYLTDEMPAQLIVEELEAWKKSRKDELTAAWAEVESLRTKLKEKKGEPANLDEVNSSLKELQRLQEENRQLKERAAGNEARLKELSQKLQEATAKLATMPTDEESSPLEPPSLGRFITNLLQINPWYWTALGVLFFIGIIMGIYLMDVTQRRRHGGFRV
ncbi:MAG: TIGR04211 family SH3 domain-containing protein [Gammaproteobacteria bacterium]|nr:TIGR04211 family SH3 domain-containing protein [Gammaproteobacteria bacterium]